MDYIAEKAIKRQAWKYWFVLLAWPAYLVILPGLLHAWGWWSLVTILFPGLYLFTWAGYLMHECWHKYVPGLPNRLFYQIFAWMLITDPQMYGMLHGQHHSEVNTWEDREFHPLGRIANPFLRQVYNFLEIIGGVAFLVVVATLVVPRLPRYRNKFKWWKFILSVVLWGVFFLGLGVASSRLFGSTRLEVAVAFALMFYVGSFFLHQSQLVEHGNLIVPGDWNQRNVKTRNLQSRTLAEKIFLFMTHNDAYEHVLHHTLVKVYSRPFPGRVPLPPEPVVIGLMAYLGVLGDMLAGREETVTLE